MTTLQLFSQILAQASRAGARVAETGMPQAPSSAQEIEKPAGMEVSPESQMGLSLGEREPDPA